MLEVERQRLDGAITHGERHNKIIDIWHRATENVSDEMFSEMKRVEEEKGEFNPIFMMADSGARGSKEQVRQLAGMRGLMSKPLGMGASVRRLLAEVIETKGVVIAKREDQGWGRPYAQIQRGSLAVAQQRVAGEAAHATAWAAASRGKP